MLRILCWSKTREGSIWCYVLWHAAERGNEASLWRRGLCVFIEIGRRRIVGAKDIDLFKHSRFNQLKKKKNWGKCNTWYKITHLVACQCNRKNFPCARGPGEGILPGGGGGGFRLKPHIEVKFKWMWFPIGILQSPNFSLREGSKKKFDTASSRGLP